MKEVIYKYFRVNLFLYDTLLSNQLYFSSNSQFNDPYDCYMSFFDSIKNEDFESYIDSLKISINTKTKYLQAFNKNPKEFVKPFVDAYKELINNFGICCFTKGKNNILLWSHYADSHKGVCLGFDYDLMKKKFSQFEEVEYNEEPFSFDFKDFEKSVGKTILRKSADWRYEEEIRFIMERSKVIDFYQDALLEVNFGTRCNNRDKMNIYQLISKLDYPNCRFKNAIINPKKYRVEFNDCDIKKLRKDLLQDSLEIKFKHSIELKHLL